MEKFCCCFYEKLLSLEDLMKLKRRKHVKLRVGDVSVKYLENYKGQITLLHYRCLS